MSSIFERIMYQSIEQGGSSLSMESDSREYEIEVYVEGLDIAAIVSESTHKEEQEQWGVYIPKDDNNASFGSVRVRRTLTFRDKESEPELNLVLTTKTQGVDGGAIETNTFVGHETFQQFASMADSGLIKTRYFIPFSFEQLSLIAEVDVFTNKEGETVPWTKIDIEYPEGVDYSTHPITPSALPAPLQPTSPDKVYVVAPSDLKDSPVRKKVEALYERYFRAKNKLV